MKRHLPIILGAVVMLVVLLVIVMVGGAGRATSGVAQRATSTQQTSPPQTLTNPAPRTTTTAPRVAPPSQTGPPPPVAPRTDCRLRAYPDGALSTDPNCAPGALDPAVAGHIADTVCNSAWVTTHSGAQPSARTRDILVTEYQLPGNPVTYTAAQVIPVQDGGSATNPQNLYPLPVDGWGGEMTHAAAAGQLHDQICAHKITIAQAANTLERDWLTVKLAAH